MPTIVTSALPYANGPIHLGHLVEYIQTDIFARFLKMTGEDAIYICADDTHGTPIELKSRELSINPKELIEKIHKEHSDDFKAFKVGFDIFYSTDSKENKFFAEYIYSRLKEQNYIVKKTIPGMFCENDKRFLPDRYVRGTCPKCGSLDQYGDSCEICSATYDPSDLKDAKCSLCGNKPVRKNSEHLFFELSKCTDFLREWTQNSGALKNDVANFVTTWLKEGLKDWCISRDGPYFGFPIPNEENKFFYVWLDAPIGYISSTKKYCDDKGLDFDSFWRNPKGTVYHFIGKDIVYFHTLFWPAMLKLSGFNLPNNVFVHGFLTVNGEKMSKSRGTFITARKYLDAMGEEFGPSYLRYYYASKLTGRADDIDLSIEDFRLKVNAGLVNNLCNFHNRCFTFCSRQFNGRLGKLPSSHPLKELAEKTTKEVEAYFRNLEFNKAIEKIGALGDAGNKFFQDAAPWDKIKSKPDEALSDITLCVNIVKLMAVMLKPVLPDMIEKLEKQLNVNPLKWSDAKFDMEDKPIGQVDKLIIPIDTEKVNAIIITPAETKPQGQTITINEFNKMDLRVATVLEAEKVPKTSKLLKLKVDLGTEIRTVVSGIAECYNPQDLINTQVIIIANLEPATIRGIESKGMILAAHDNVKLVIVKPEKNSVPGSKVS